jgi:CelD/BcsL family acetyltransferase involved in cellulose biosynthesis
MILETFLFDSVEIGTSAAMMLNSIAVAARPAQSFLRASWFAAASPEAKAVAARREDGRPLAAIPTVRRRIGPFAMNEVTGCYWPYRSVPIADETSDCELEAMLREPKVRARLGLVWRMGPVHARDGSALRLVGAAEQAGWTVLRRRLGTCFELDLGQLRAAGPWPRSSTLRKNRWREKRLAELGEVSYRFRTGAEWTARDRDDMAAIEANSWVAKLGRGGNTKFLDPDCRRNWEQVAQDPVLAGMLSFGVMTIGERPAAFTFGLEVGGTRYMIANGYDERFARHGPGKILLYKDFERAAERGIGRISWGSGDAGYKSEMGAEPGPDIVDLLFVRPRALALPLRLAWGRHGKGDGEVRRPPSDREDADQA